MNTIYDSSLLLVDDNEDLCRMLTDMLCRRVPECGVGRKL